MDTVNLYDFTAYPIINLLNSITCILLTLVGTVLFFKTTNTESFYLRPKLHQWLIKLALVGLLCFSLSTALYNTYTRIDNLIFHLFMLTYLVKELLEEVYLEKK